MTMMLAKLWIENSISSSKSIAITMKISVLIYNRNSWSSRVKRELKTPNSISLIIYSSIPTRIS